MRAKDVMSTKLLTVRLNTPVGEIAELLTKNRIGGVPVVNEEGALLGIVTESDLFLKEKGVPFSLVRLPTLFNQWVDPERLEGIYERSRRFTAADVMTADVAFVAPDAELSDVAAVMVQRRVKRVPVVADGKLVGIITRRDLIGLMAIKK